MIARLWQMILFFLEFTLKDQFKIIMSPSNFTPCFLHPPVVNALDIFCFWVVFSCMIISQRVNSPPCSMLPDLPDDDRCLPWQSGSHGSLCEVKVQDWQEVYLFLHQLSATPWVRPPSIPECRPMLPKKATSLLSGKLSVCPQLVHPLGHVWPPLLLLLGVTPGQGKKCSLTLRISPKANAPLVWYRRGYNTIAPSQHGKLDRIGLPGRQRL